MRVTKYNSLTNIDKNKIDPRLGNRIRAARKEMQMTIGTLADKVGVSQSYVTRIERADRRCDSMTLLVKFAEVLNIPVEELLTLAGQDIQNERSYLRLAFPSIQTDEQEEAIFSIAQLITDPALSGEDIEQLVKNASAYAAYCKHQ
ncbi:MAG: helix-turn-helix transcriptional regulator [Lachnospiraceae bacterium]|nr:helix-turn-helix transcriptional regulator [Lachnospiraceae bacterium]